MDRVPENDPVAIGENRTTTGLDWPGARLKGPLPETTEKGGEGTPTFPASVPVEFAWLVMVSVCSKIWPTAPLPKSTDVGLMEMLIVAGGAGPPVPLSGTFTGLF